MGFDVNLQLEKARKKVQDAAEKFVKGVHTFHKAAAASHESSANDFEKDSSEHTHHSTMAAAHTAAADSCLACLEECSKVVWGDLFKSEQAAPVASPISAVATDAPPNVRAVTRTGGRPMPVQTHPVVSSGSVDFNKLIGLEELEEL
jgi:hypothetical protein